MPDPETQHPPDIESIGIINALRRGTVPAQGLGRFAVGLEVEEQVIAGQLDLVSRGGADIKFFRGDYGSGKTFLIARALEIARSKGFVTAHVSISPVSPLHRLRALYSQMLILFISVIIPRQLHRQDNNPHTPHNQGIYSHQ